MIWYLVFFLLWRKKIRECGTSKIVSVAEDLTHICTSCYSDYNLLILLKRSRIRTLPNCFRFSAKFSMLQTNGWKHYFHIPTWLATLGQTSPEVSPRIYERQERAVQNMTLQRKSKGPLSCLSSIAGQVPKTTL